MSRLNFMPWLLLGVFLILFIVFLMNAPSYYRILSSSDDSSLVEVDTLQLVRRQRDQLSTIVRQLSKEYHQYQCEVGVSKNVSSHGGWCTGARKHAFDKSLADELVDLFEGSTVAGFGDGDGYYKTHIDKSGNVPVYDCYDGAPFCENKTGGLVKFLDLAMPVFGLKLYDWIISLEVGEHIPKEFEQTFLDNIVRHARKGIVLSWARLEQGGVGHVNSHPLEYIVDQLEKRGFLHDKEASAKLRATCTLRWLQQNVQIYWRKSGHDADELMI